MLPIERKTTGTLIDESITCSFKIKAGVVGTQSRLDTLSKAIDTRIKLSVSDIVILDSMIRRLEIVSEKCWDAQEKVCNLDESHPDIGRYAKAAQSANAKRASLIREIDTILGEGDETVLEKTYA